jgi:ABC-type transport system involved in multi-copper enzyme maturation permease subunit
MIIWIIAQKEFLQNLKTLKFSLFLIFSVLLVLLSVFISIRNYESRLTEHLNIEDYQKEKKDEEKINRKPEVLSILARGANRRIGNSIPIQFYINALFKASSYIGHFSQRMRFMSEFSDIDFAFIVQVIFSLLAIILVYDTISGERAHGQLRLILSNSVPRANLLIGKFIGNALCLLLPFGSCFVLGLLVIQLSPSVQLTNEDWARIAIMFGISALYLLAFLNLGTLVSCKTHTPALSLLILLSLWIWLIVVHPKLSVFAAEKFAPVESEARMGQQLRQVYEDYQQKSQKDQKETGGRYGLLLFIQEAKENKKLYDKFLNQFAQQARVADWVSKASPVGCYDSAMTAVAKTDVASHDRWLNSVRSFWSVYAAFHEARQQKKLEGKKQEADEMKKNPPQFVMTSESISESLYRAMPGIAMLIFFNIIFFMLSYLFFLRYEV